ncbi:hypothetical protein NKJ09_18895 [Mesorhizobium sp. M0189]|uniref:hypothetical protein n=1 Tax=unclassified Mesorhizobium TaxID=325217 RepID=UPI0033383ED5
MDEMPKTTRNLRFSLALGIVSWLLLGSSVPAAAARLSPAQASVVTAEIAKLKYPEERALAKGWTDAKKVAEFICRPAAMKALKHRIKGVDRVFLGTDDPSTLQLVSNRRLTGSGQARTGDDWQAFSFSCGLNPQTGKAISFEIAPLPSTGSVPAAEDKPAPKWPRYFGPGPVRSPTFNPKKWPGQTP